MGPDKISRMSGNAVAIDKTLLLLKEELQKLKSEVVRRMFEKETAENKRLKSEVETWTSKLVQAEIRNGKKQVEPNKTQPPAPTKLDKASVPKKEQPKKSDPSKKPQAKQEKSDSSSTTETVDVSRLDFRIGRIVNVKKHPDAESLYVEEIDVAEDKPRTVVSGLVKHVPIEEMQDRLVVLLCNLKPAKMRGVLSEAMVMCASGPDKVEILVPPEGSCPGDRIQFEGFPGAPDQQLNPKKKIFEQLAPDLKTDDKKVATYKGVAFTVSGKGVVLAPSLTCTQIK